MEIKRSKTREYLQKHNHLLDAQFKFDTKVNREQKRKIKVLAQCFPEYKFTVRKDTLTITMHLSKVDEIWQKERKEFIENIVPELEGILKSY